jgi:pimeloyl-ACP methyl ester carboxylesterase
VTPRNERFCRSGGVRLCFETFGREGDPTLLLIMGLGAQMVAWNEELCAALAARGFFVVRYDNRDCGRSTHLADEPEPTFRELATRRLARPAYTLDDLAEDAIALLDHLGIDAAHVIGASMGGMIAQVLAARHPARVRSLVSVMSSTGSRTSGQPSLRLLRLLLRRPPAERDAFVARMLQIFRVSGSARPASEVSELRAMLELSFDRGMSPEGIRRQLGAIFLAGDRTAALGAITAPTLVIHGTADRLIAPSGGRATARAIPGARLMLIAGMGHDLPRATWPRILHAITDHARRAAVAPNTNLEMHDETV